MSNSLFSAVVLKNTVHSPWMNAAEMPQPPLTGSPLSPGSPRSPRCPGGPIKPLNHINWKSVTHLALMYITSFNTDNSRINPFVYGERGPHLPTSKSLDLSTASWCSFVHTHVRKRRRLSSSQMCTALAEQVISWKKKKKEDKETKNACRAPNCCRWGTREGDPLAMRLWHDKQMVASHKICR